MDLNFATDEVGQINRTARSSKGAKAGIGMTAHIFSGPFEFISILDIPSTSNADRLSRDVAEKRTHDR